MKNEKNDDFVDQVEGRNSVIELLESGRDINKIFISNEMGLSYNSWLFKV